MMMCVVFPWLLGVDTDLMLLTRVSSLNGWIWGGGLLHWLKIKLWDCSSWKPEGWLVWRFAVSTYWFCFWPRVKLKEETNLSENLINLLRFSPLASSKFMRRFMSELSLLYGLSDWLIVYS